MPAQKAHLPADSPIFPDICFTSLSSRLVALLRTSRDVNRVQGHCGLHDHCRHNLHFAQWMRSLDWLPGNRSADQWSTPVGRSGLES